MTFCCAFLAFNCFQHFLKQQPDFVMVRSEVGHRGCVSVPYKCFVCLYKAIFKDPDLFFFFEAAELYPVFQIIYFNCMMLCELEDLF